MLSKIKRIESTNEWTGPNGTIIYHSLEMENGDKINIGKKKLQQIGWEVSYEITDTSQEYNKAKGIMQEGQSFTPQAKTPQNDKTSDQILWSVCLKEATALYGLGVFDLDELTQTGNEGKLDTIIFICQGLFNRSKAAL
jgi:hypothetical protein